MNVHVCMLDPHTARFNAFLQVVGVVLAKNAGNYNLIIFMRNN